MCTHSAPPSTLTVVLVIVSTLACPQIGAPVAYNGVGQAPLVDMRTLPYGARFTPSTLVLYGGGYLMWHCPR